MLNMPSKAISLFHALRGAVVKKALAQPEPKSVIKKEAVDTSYLERFGNLSAELKKEFVKTASAMGCNRRDIYDMVSSMNKGIELEKQSEYLKWYKEITSS